MLTLNGWAIDERSYAARLAASLMDIPLAWATDRRAETFGPTLTDEMVSCVGLYEILEHFSRASETGWLWPEGEARQVMKWALDGIELFSEARREALAATLPRKAETEPVTFLFREMEDRLSAGAFRDEIWFSGRMIGFVDVILFPVAALAHDLGVAMDLYPALRRFIRQVRQLPGFIVMPGIASCH